MSPGELQRLRLATQLRAGLFGVLYVLVHGTWLPQILANLTAYAVATVWNYLLNYYWSFRSVRPHRQAGLRFMIIVLIGLAANSGFVAATSLFVPVVWAGLAFSMLWPLASFAALKAWALS